MIKLREIRKARGLSQEQLADAVRCEEPMANQAMISYLENGDIYPGDKLMSALCKALDCEEDDLYTGIEALFIPAAEKVYSPTTQIISEIFAEHPGEKIPRGDLRKYVSDKLGRQISDRVMRHYLEKARQEGMVIDNKQDGAGYYLPNNAKEAKALLKRNDSRAKSVLSQQKHIRNLVRGIEQ